MPHTTGGAKRGRCGRGRVWCWGRGQWFALELGNPIKRGLTSTHDIWAQGKRPLHQSTTTTKCSISRHLSMQNSHMSLKTNARVFKKQFPQVFGSLPAPSGLLFELSISILTALCCWRSCRYRCGSKSLTLLDTSLAWCECGEGGNHARASMC